MNIIIDDREIFLEDKLKIDSLIIINKKKLKVENIMTNTIYCSHNLTSQASRRAKNLIQHDPTFIWMLRSTWLYNCEVIAYWNTNGKETCPVLLAQMLGKCVFQCYIQSYTFYVNSIVTSEIFIYLIGIYRVLMLSGTDNVVWQFLNFPHNQE